MSLNERPNSRRAKVVDRLLGPRIAQKIFIGYVLPLSVLLAFGIILPIFLWFYLGRSVHNVDGLILLADNAASLKRAAVDSDNHAGGFIRYHDPGFEQDFAEARETYRVRYRDVAAIVEEREDPALTHALEDVGTRYRAWIRGSVNQPYRQAQTIVRNHVKVQPAVAQAEAVHVQFGLVEQSLDSFISLVNQKLIRQARRSYAADMMRHITSLVIPLVAIVLSLLIGRSTALGITRPLEALMNATRELERGTPPVRLLIEDTENPIANDEIGDLQQAFRQMVRTIGQREAVLHAQNEAVGALNRRIESVLNATNDGILMLDRAGGFSVVNQRLADLFGLEMDNLLDHTFGQAGTLLLSRFKNKAFVRKRLQAVIDDPDAIADEIFDLAEPQVRTIRVYSAPVRGHQFHNPSDSSGEVPSAELLGRIFVFRDVTRETMLDRMKTEFVSTVSHELRTPLTAIKGYVDLMVSGQTGPLNDVQTEFLTLVQGSTRRLTNLINDMLDVSKIESGRMEMRQESVNYLPLVRQTIRMMQQEADARGITLAVEAPGEDARRSPIAVRGDSDRITQILTNFLSNGIKYTHAGGHVTIRIEFEDEFVTTCVADDGIGISPEDQRRLFQKFFRADNSTTREVGGTGLGLAITKAILEKLNGSVWVESEKNAGSRFYFTLPCVSSAESETSDSVDIATSDRPQIEGGGLLVLPVSGDLAGLHRLGHELRRQGFVTSGASTFAEALRRVRDLRPDVILMDPLTPHFDGRALLKALGTFENPISSPIVITSVHLQNGNAALLRDDIALVDSGVGAPDALANAVQTAISSAEERRSEQTLESADSHPLTIISLSRDKSQKERIERCVPELGRTAIVISAATVGDIEPYLRAESSLRIPDIIVVGDFEDDKNRTFGDFLSRLRKRKHDEWIACILLMDRTDTRSLKVQTLAPIGSGGVPIDDLGPYIRRLVATTQAKADT